MEHLTTPVLLLLLISSFSPLLCTAQSGDRGDDEDQVSRHSTFACQYGLLMLECPPHHVIRIQRANYGRFSSRICNPDGITENMDLQCQSVTAVEIVSTKCDGHNRCRFEVTSELFGDPCPGTSKYAEVKHYCEPVKSEGDSGLKPLPDAPHPPRLPSVPVPENIQVCQPPMSRGSIYDLTWQMPPTDQIILHFGLKYRVNGETFEAEMTGTIKIDDNKYVYVFPPKEDKRSFQHQFAIKAFSFNYGWGDYSQFISAGPCRHDEDGGIVTHNPIVISTSDNPDDGGVLKQMCHPVILYGIRWAETAPGEVRTSACPLVLGEGVMHYKCLSNGMWDPNGPETDKCLEKSSTTKPTTTTTTTTTTSLPPTISSKPIFAPIRYNKDVIDKIHILVRPGNPKQEKYNLTSFLPDVTKNWTQHIEKTKEPRQRKAMAEGFKDTMLALSDELLKDGNAWNNMSVSQQRSTAASILDSVESSGLLAASTLSVGASNTTRKSNVVMKVMNVGVASGQAAVLDDRSLTGSRAKVNRFLIPHSVLTQVAGHSKGSVPVVFVVMSNISEWLTPEAITTTSTPGSNVIDARPTQEPTRRLVNTDVISVSVSKHRVKKLVEPVVFLMEHRQMESVANPQCSFWDPERGGWSTEGCQVSESNKTHTTCQCTHLTSFAVLMDITGATLEMSDGQRFSLDLITYIGCTISIICLLLSWVTFACFKNLDCDRNTIHKHLVFCLMIAQIVLVVGIQQTQPPVLCSIIAGVLHFFFLASFAWMCLEGVQLYVMLIEVFESERSRVLYYYLFGYGVPAVIVGVSAAVFPRGYGTEFHCWLTIERGFIWSFVGPALAVLLVNFVMLGIAIFTMVRHSAMSHTMRQKSVPQKMRTWMKGAVVLVVLLGLTWVFGVLYLDNVYHTLIFSYIFTILNSLQGLFIFIFHCLLNEKVQKEYRRVVRRGRWLPSCLRTRYGGTSSSGSGENSYSGNVMSRFFRGKKRHSGCGDSSNNSAKPFLHKEQRHLSSSAPSSSDGVISSRLSSETSNNNQRKTSHASSYHPGGPDSRFLRPMDVNGIAGDLSEVLDCSVVDSEFVSEYCQQNLQVSTEAKRYSTSSEDSGGGDEIEDDSGGGTEASLDRLAGLSVESLSKRHSDFISTSDLGDGKSGGGTESDGGVEGNAETTPATFVNPARGMDVPGQDQKDDKEEDGLMGGKDMSGRPGIPENQPLMIKQTESERVLIHNAANKPREIPQGDTSPKQSPSLTHIDLSKQEGKDSTPVHTSVPCLKFKPSTTIPADVADTEKDCVNSLPDLSHVHSNGTAKPLKQDSSDQSPSVKRHSSDGHMNQLSPQRVSSSDC